MSQQFIYSVLQYKHSLALGEALNIGILFSFPEENKLYFVPGDTQRVKCVYPNFDTTIFSKISKNIKSKVKDRGEAFHPFLISGNSFKNYINQEILPEDSTSLQFTEPLTALNDSGNSDQAIQEFSKLLLPGSEEIKVEIKHNEPYLLKAYTDKLISKVDRVKLDTRLRKDYEVRTKKASLTFEIAWKNETLLHLVKPISFDLKEEINIQDKSVRFWGYLGLLDRYARDHNYSFDLLIAAPQQPHLQEAYLNALDVLHEAKAPKRIITEENLEEYSQETALNLNKEIL